MATSGSILRRMAASSALRCHDVRLRRRGNVATMPHDGEGAVATIATACAAHFVRGMCRYNAARRRGRRRHGCDRMRGSLRSGDMSLREGRDSSRPRLYLRSVATSATLPLTTIHCPLPSTFLHFYTAIFTTARRRRYNAARRRGRRRHDCDRMFGSLRSGDVSLRVWASLLRRFRRRGMWRRRPRRRRRNGCGEAAIAHDASYGILCGKGRRT